jgi:hypothetical protein
MHHTLRLTPLLALAVLGACGGEGERSAGGFGESAIEDQRPPGDQQQAPPSSDRALPSESESANANTCEGLCAAAQGHCPIGGTDSEGTSECVSGCRRGTTQFPQCTSEYLQVLRCIVQNGLIDCGSGEAEDDAVSEECGSELDGLRACVRFPEPEEEEPQ